MRLVFAHDHKFELVQGRYYSTGGLPSQVLKRYSDLFGDVCVLSRVQVVAGKEPADEPIRGIKFASIDRLSRLFRRQNWTMVRDLISENDALIARLPSFLGLAAIFYACRLRKPYLIEVVGCPFDSLWNHSLPGKLLAPIMWALTKNAISRANYVIYVTQNFLQNRYPTRGRSLGVSDVSLQHTESSLERRIDRISSHSGPIILGTIAAVDVRYKGQQLVIRAISELTKQGHNLEYQLVGGGDTSYLEMVAKKNGVSDRVHFLGVLPHNKVYDWLESIDVYIQPSRLEGLPRSLIEAMSKGIPSVASSVGGIPELLPSSRLFESGNIGHLIQVLVSLLGADMSVEAMRTYRDSIKYGAKELDKKRNTFYREFKDYAQSQQT